MSSNPSYRTAFYYALAFHLCIVLLLFTDTSAKKPVLTLDAKNTPEVQQSVPVAAQQEIVKAVSVDNQEVMDTINRIKEARAVQIRAEQNRQNQLNQQAEAAKQQRIKEQKEIVRLKQEANKIAITRKKEALEEQKKLKELAAQKVKEAKRIEELKKQKEVLEQQKKLEAQKLAELNKKKALEIAHAQQLKEAQAKAIKMRAAQQEAEAASAVQRQQAEAAKLQSQARLSGVVDKYKALIVDAIGRNWILPERANSSLSSQFRIRLAPDGMVLSVSLTRSSGDPLLDRSAQTAIYKASPLPVPHDAETFNMFREISLTVRPEQVRG
jgi:colicin import membrane protein